jgi:hypothetical protein
VFSSTERRGNSKHDGDNKKEIPEENKDESSRDECTG